MTAYDPTRYAPVPREAAVAIHETAVQAFEPASNPVAPAEVAAAAGGPSLAISEPVPTATPAAPAPRFVGPRERLGEVAILDAVEFGGEVWSSIPLRRPSSVEVGRYFEQLAEAGAKDPERKLYFPVFAKPDGTPVPHEVLDFLDDDDRSVVMERAVDFLPSRLLRLLGA